MGIFDFFRKKQQNHKNNNSETPANSGNFAPKTDANLPYIDIKGEDLNKVYNQNIIDGAYVVQTANVCIFYVV